MSQHWMVVFRVLGGKELHLLTSAPDDDVATGNAIKALRRHEPVLYHGAKWVRTYPTTMTNLVAARFEPLSGSASIERGWGGWQKA
jgi:hypothetical protein